MSSTIPRPPREQLYTRYCSTLTPQHPRELRTVSIGTAVINTHATTHALGASWLLLSIRLLDKHMCSCSLAHTRTQPSPSRAALLPSDVLHPHKCSWNLKKCEKKSGFIFETKKKLANFYFHKNVCLWLLVANLFFMECPRLPQVLKKVQNRS